MNLKPCPFCGNPDTVVLRNKKGQGTSYRGSCRGCGALGPRFFVQPWHYGNKFVAQGQAEAAWNKRTGRRERS